MVVKMTLGHVIFRVSPLSFVTSFHHYFVVILNLEDQRATHGNIKQSSALAAMWELWTTQLFHFLFFNIPI